jgi:1,4-dihydroxy-6-naphthoate synthase
VTTLAVSPCPNDTFIVHALVHGLVPSPSPVEISYDDIDVLNHRAEQAGPDLVKVSFGAVPWLLEDYQLLPSGGALGRGCGPLVVVRPGPVDLDRAVIAIPGERTTAYLLLRLWLQGRTARVRVMPFDQIMPAVARKEVDAGLIIHESRFTYPQHGLVELVDLGAFWEEQTGLPIPLGGVLARRGLDRAAWTEAVRASVEHAWADPEDPGLLAYIAEHAREMDPHVQRQHIDLYVTEFSRDLGAEGYAAIRELLDTAAQAGLVPFVDLDR